MRPQVILFLPSFESGGVERNAVCVANGLAERQVDVHVLYCRQKTQWFDQLAPTVRRLWVAPRVNLPVLHERLVDALNMLLFARSEVRRVQELGPTVMLSFQSNVVGIVLARLCGLRVAVRLSNHPSAARHERSVLRWFAERAKAAIYPWADIRIANSADLAEAYRRHWSAEVIYNPVDSASVVQKAGEQIDEAPFREKQRPIVISVGRLARQKNFALALRAMQIVLRQVSCDFVLLGEGDERGRLEQLAGDLRIREHVHLIGKRSNVYKYLKHSDIFVLSSDYEGFPNALLEAVACGLPTVATECPTGPREILCDGAGGWLVPPGDEQGLAKAILSALANPAAAAGKVAAASDGLRRFALNTINDKYYDVVTRLLHAS